MTAKFSILSKKIISFDIFDTLLVRPYANPNGIFLLLEKLYNKQGFPLARKMAERKAIQNTTEEEITFDEIYDNIEDEYKFLKDKEEELEINTIQPNPEIKKLYDFAIKHNKKVIITSDMYLPKETILKILHKNGYNNFYKLYLSSDIKKTKHTGNLFKYIIDDLKVKPSQILHIGDNEIADIQNAKKLGIKTLLIPKISDKFLKKNKSFQSINTNNLFSSILLGINSIHYINNKKEKFYNKLGYQLTAPLTYSYTKFIESECKNKNISQLFFIARDGYILNKLFNIFNNDIKTKYIYGQRILNIICGIGFENKTISNEVLKEYFLKKLNMNKNESIENFTKNNNSIIQNLIENNFKEYKKYLKSQNFDTSKAIGIVDFCTYNFSTQKLIEKTLENENVLGFYFTILNNKPTTFKHTKFYNLTDIKITGNIPFCEEIIGAPEPTIKDVPTTDIITYANKNKYEKFHIKIAKIMEKMSIQFANDIKNIFGDYIEIHTTGDDVINYINTYLDTPLTKAKKMRHSGDANHKKYTRLSQTKKH